MDLLKLEFHVLLLASLSLFCCGENLFKSVETSDPGEEAIKYLEQNKPESAADVMLSALGSDIKIIYLRMGDMEEAEIADDLNIALNKKISEGEHKASIWMSILASAHAQKFEIDLIDIALSFAKQSSQGDGSGGGNAITLLYPVLPEATSENKKGLSEAIAILNSIPASLLNASDKFKKSIFLTANMSLITKTLDKNEDGEISAAEALDLDADNADNLYSVLANASKTMAGAEAGSSDAAAAEQIEALQKEIDAQDGDDKAEKLREFLASGAADDAEKSP